MGSGAEYVYGPVTDYSIKMNMNGTAGRGWTWGIAGSAPIAALSNTGAFSIASTLTVGGGTGKINVGTVDPLYTIGGKRYATFLPAMTGQKEETTGTVTCKIKKGECSYVMNFATAEEASDVWLFGKVTNIEKQFDKLTVIVTPGFDGKVWYEKDSAKKTVTIRAKSEKGAKEAEISYRLTAPRFDGDSWSNRATESEEGFNLDKLLAK
jgi:hypothetical protein